MGEVLEKINEQANKITDNLKYIKENISKKDGPIFVELIGTAKSGKTTLLNSITELLTRHGVPVQKRAETAEYNPITNKNLEEYNIWMYNDGSIPTADAFLLKQLFSSEFMKRYKPLAYGFVTSPELSVFRKGKEGRLVNRKNVGLFNQFMEAEKENIAEGARKIYNY